jgi:Ca2+-transporting ATPase
LPKTGTLTEGKMKVVEVLGNRDELAKQAVLANDMDDPVVLAAWEWAKKVVDSPKELKKVYPRLDSIPFSSEYQFFASLNSWWKDQNVIFLNGAPEVIMEKCGLSKEEKQELQDQIDEQTSEGKRLIGMARKMVSDDKEELVQEDTKSGFEWMGILAFTDPVRSDVKDALKKTSKAGIRLMVITGDYAKTAQSVMRQLELDVAPERVILGEQLKDMAEKDLLDLIRSTDQPLLFARTKPNQKLKIVEVLKRNGEVVAMMGDGVNDAPAVSKADIGIVVAEASDVAKESADLVLLDSSFSTIVAAIEEGRGIFNNARKVILFLMCDAFEGIFLVLVSTVMRLPLPVTAMQILWINLISDGFPNLALTVDPKTPDIMNRPPRSPKENLVAPWMYKLIGVVSLTGGVTAYILYTTFLNRSGDLTLARSIAFATIGVNSSIYVYSVRTLTRHFWKSPIFENKWLLIAVLASFVFQFLPFWIAPMRKVFNVVPLGVNWSWVFLASFIVFMVIEVFKLLFKRSWEGQHA